MKKKRLHVHTTTTPGIWCVRREGAKRALKRYPSQGAAMYWAAQRALEEDSGPVVIHTFTARVLGYFDPKNQSNGIYR